MLTREFLETDRHRVTAEQHRSEQRFFGFDVVGQQPTRSGSGRGLLAASDIFEGLNHGLFEPVNLDQERRVAVANRSSGQPRKEDPDRAKLGTGEGFTGDKPSKIWGKLLNLGDNWQSFAKLVPPGHELVSCPQHTVSVERMFACSVSRRQHWRLVDKHPHTLADVGHRVSDDLSTEVR